MLIIKRALNKMVVWATREEPPKPQPVYAQEVLNGSELAFVAYRIDNGYLLRLTSNGSMGPVTIIYCKDEQAIMEQVVAHRAKAKLNIGPTQSHPRYGVNPTYVATEQVNVVKSSLPI